MLIMSIYRLGSKNSKVLTDGMARDWRPDFWTLDDFLDKDLLGSCSFANSNKDTCQIHLYVIVYYPIASGIFDLAKKTTSKTNNYLLKMIHDFLSNLKFLFHWIKLLDPKYPIL